MIGVDIALEYLDNGLLNALGVLGVFDCEEVPFFVDLGVLEPFATATEEEQKQEQEQEQKQEQEQEDSDDDTDLFDRGSSTRDDDEDDTNVDDLLSQK